MQRNPSRFRGLMTYADAKDIPPGFMVEQRNLGNFRPGRLDVRGGLHPISDLLSNITAADSHDLLGVFGHSSPYARWLVGHRVDGSIKARRDTSSGGTAPLVPTSDNFDINYPCCFVRDAIGGLLIFNGLQRGYRWDGVMIGASASAHDAGVSSPEDIAATTSSPPSIANSGTTTGPTASGTYVAGYRYRDRWGYFSNLSELAEFSADGSGHGFVWSSLVSSTQAVNSQYRGKYIELFRSTDNAPNTLYLVARLGNKGVIVSATGNGATATITLEAGHSLIAGCVVSITGVSGLTSLTITSVTSTTATGNSSYNSSDSDGGAWSLTGYTLDDETDADLEASSIDSSINILNPDFSVSARAYGLPPNDKPYFASFQDVMFAYGRVNYSVGTASGTSGTSVITLSAAASPKTEWAGRRIIISSTGVEYDIVSVNEGTRELTIDRKLTGTLSAVSYVVTPASTRANLLCFSRPGQQEGFLETDAIRVHQPSDATDLETGLMQFGQYLYLFHEYHTYQLSFNADPRYDGQVGLVSYRGAVNNRSWCLDNENAYIFDQKGGYKISGPCCPDDLTTASIKNIFTETIDWSDAKKKWYFASCDPYERVVRYHVSYTGDSTTYPKRAVCYSTQTGEWWTEQYPFEISGATEYPINGTMRLVLGGPDDKYLVMGTRGTGDGLAAPVQGTTLTCLTTTSTTWTHTGQADVAGGIDVDSVDVYISVTDATAADRSALLAGVQVGYIITASDSGGTRTMQVSAIFDHTTIGDGYYQFTISEISDTGFSYDPDETVTTVIQRAATAGENGVLTASSAVFTSAMAGLPIGIVAGKGAGSTGTISAYTSTTKVTLSGVSSTWEMDSTSVFVVGAISASVKTGMLNIPEPQSQDGKKIPVSVQRQVSVAFTPTTYDSWLAASMYLNEESSAVTPTIRYESRGVSWPGGSQYAQFSSKKTQFSRGDDPGTRVIPIDKAVADASISDRYLSAMLSVLQGISPVSIRAIECEGVA